jgi:putative DNA primase/helicase
MTVARTYRQLHSEREIYIAGDNDHRREAEGKPNVGREKAEEAAAAIKGFALLPTFSADDLGSDWNDLAGAQGEDAAREQLGIAIAIAEREQVVRAMTVDRTNGRDHDQSADLNPVLDNSWAAEIELG